MNLVPCNFSLESYLWFQIELVLCAHSILKSHAWFQPKLHSTQLNYHYKWYKHGRLKLSKLEYSSESSLFSSHDLQGTSEKKKLSMTLPPLIIPCNKVCMKSRSIAVISQPGPSLWQAQPKTNPFTPRNNELVTFPFDIHTLYIVHLISIWQTGDYNTQTYHVKVVISI